MIRTICRVNTHFYAPNNSTACTNAIYKLSDVLESATYLNNILHRRDQLFHSFCRLIFTDGQSLSTTVSRRLRYCKGVTVSSGCPYDWNIASPRPCLLL